MKKALLLVSILSISVFSTACINNFAVQELNNKAKTFMEQGDYQGAIERLKSSIDLDDTIFESHYNLAVAYTQSEDYINAIPAYQKAIELKPDFADAYYSLAVALESLAVSIDSGDVSVNENGEIVEPDIDSNSELSNVDDISLQPKTLSPHAKKVKNDLLTEAVNNYNKYLEIAQNPQDADDVKAKVKSLQEQILPVADLSETKNAEVE